MTDVDLLVIEPRMNQLNECRSLISPASRKTTRQSRILSDRIRTRALAQIQYWIYSRKSSCENGPLFYIVKDTMYVT